MGYRITGQYLASCECRQICGCAMDQPPTGKNGTCTGGLVFNIKGGALDDVDLSGVKVLMMYNAPGNITGGNLKFGLVVDEAASNAQVDALEQIFSGKIGGPFGEFVPLIGEFLPTERAKITYTDGESPKASIGSSSIAVEAFRDAEGTPTTISNAMLGFAPTFTIGQGSGTVEACGLSYDGNYGEVADFEFAS